MVNRIIKSFTFLESIRRDIVFSDSDKIRLNTEVATDPKIMLKADVNDQFSTDGDIYVKTPLSQPNRVQQWLKFEAIKYIPDGTDIKYRLYTNAGEFYWNSGLSQWESAGLSDWNTEQEINDNLDQFPVGDRSLGFIINLSTTDPDLTPEIYEIKFLGLFDIDFLEDLIYDSVIRKINTEFRSTSDLVFLATGSNSFDISTVLENKGYNITGIRKAFDLTADPDKLDDIFDSYVLGPVNQDGFTNQPGVITFKSAIPQGNLVRVTFEYLPEVMVITNQDFYEVPTYPSIVFESIRTMEREGFIVPGKRKVISDFIRDIPNKSAVAQINPRQEAVRFDAAIFTDRSVDQARLIDDFSNFIEGLESVKSWGLDQEYDLVVNQPFDTSRNKASKESGGADDRTDTHTAETSFEVLGVLFFNKPSVDKPLVAEGQFNVTLKNID